MIRLKHRASPWLGVIPTFTPAAAALGVSWRMVAFASSFIEQRDRLGAQLRLVPQRRLQFEIGQIKSGEHDGEIEAM